MKTCLPGKTLGNMDEVATAAVSKSANLHPQTSFEVSWCRNPASGTEQAGVTDVRLQSQGAWGMGWVCAHMKYFGREILANYYF